MGGVGFLEEAVWANCVCGFPAAARGGVGGLPAVAA